MTGLRVIEGGVYTSSSFVGSIKGTKLIRKESFNNLVRNRVAWTVYKDVLEHVNEIELIVEEENGTNDPDTYKFTITKEEIIRKPIRILHEKTTDLDKLIAPISWWKIETNVKSAEKKMASMGAEWFFKLRSEFLKDYMKQLSNFVMEERKKYMVYPASADVFRAYKLLPFSEVNVVIIGQDPYHNGTASGLAFSSNNEMIIPKSLQNIFTEIENDIYNGLMLDQNPMLERWVKQGVFLINTSLTVRAGEAGSHSGRGWERFTMETIKSLYEVGRPIVWMLWGKHAQDTFDAAIAAYGQVNDRHLVLRAVHPSPLSASKGFFGCKHFSKANKFLAANNIETVVW